MIENMNGIGIDLDEYDFDSISDNSDVLTIKFYNQKLSASIMFDSHLCYRVMDEGDYISLLLEMAQTPDLKGGILLKVNQFSDFIEWFLEKNRNIRDREDLIHSIISTEGPIIEVISLEKPEVILRNI